MIYPKPYSIYFRFTWGFPKVRGTLFGVPRIRIIVFCIRVPSFLGNYHLDRERMQENSPSGCFDESWAAILPTYAVQVGLPRKGYRLRACGFGLKFGAQGCLLGLRVWGLGFQV